MSVDVAQAPEDLWSKRVSNLFINHCPAEHQCRSTWLESADQVYTIFDGANESIKVIINHNSEEENINTLSA